MLPSRYFLSIPNTTLQQEPQFPVRVVCETAQRPKISSPKFTGLVAHLSDSWNAGNVQRREASTGAGRYFLPESTKNSTLSLLVPRTAMLSHAHPIGSPSYTLPPPLYHEYPTAMRQNAQSKKPKTPKNVKHRMGPAIFVVKGHIVKW